MIEPSQESQVEQNHKQFIDELCAFLIHAHNHLGIPKEVIYIHLQVHCQDIMNGIVKGAFNYSEQQENKDVRG